ncbi:MAG: stage II sporulation protein M [Clostridia bacterium]|nr:stage II sporulation protein M [Clostridia bacterium]
MLAGTQRWYVQYLKKNALLYLVVVGIFVAGILLGSLGVRVLHEDQANQLTLYLNNFINQLQTFPVEVNSYAQEVVWSNLRFLGVIYFLGLTVIGIPVILLLLLTRGFLMGFAVGFLARDKAWQGIIFALSSVLPQNLINIPVLFVAGVSAVHFSLALVRGGFSNRGERMLPYFIRYTALMAILALLTVGSGLIQAYISPVLMKTVVTYMKI